MLPITKVNGEVHLLTNIPEINLKRKVNGDKMISFKVFPSDENQSAWDSVINETVTEFKGEPYSFKQVSEGNLGDRSAKQVDAVHSFFGSMIGCYQERVHTGSLTFANALTLVFERTTYNFVPVDSIGAKTVENFGNDNCLALFQKLLETYGVEFRIVGNQVYLYRQIGADTGFQFRWKYNIKGINKVEDTYGLTTYIKGYGKPKEHQDVLSSTSIPYTTRAGSYYTETGLNLLATSTVGASFRFTFTGTGFNFRTVKTFLGGVWEFSIDGSQTVKISTYEEVVRNDVTFEIIRGLEHKAHTVVATFKGADPKNWNTSKSGGNADPLGYLLSGNIIGLYRGLTGDERFMAVAEHTSPNAAKYPNPGDPEGLHRATPISDERFTTKETLLEHMKKQLQDVPELSITVDIAELGLDNGALNEGDRGYIIYEPMNLIVDVRIVEIDETFRYIDNGWKLVQTQVTLTNSRNRMSDRMTRFSETSKRVDRLLKGDEKVPFRALDEAVAQATKALQSAQTELEFINGIVARDKMDANKLVLLNSAGLGISNDGGSTFGTAITGDGIVAEYIMAGILRGMYFVSESDDSTMWIQGGDIRLTDSNNGRNLNLNSLGMTGFNEAGEILFQSNQTWTTSGIVGTTTKNGYFAVGATASDVSGELRVVHVRGIPGDGEIASYYYLPIRTGGVYSNFVEVNAGSSGVHLYLRPRSGGEVRITGANTTDAYYPIRAGAVHSNNFVSTSTSLWMGTDSAMHIVNKGFIEDSTGTPTYRNLFASEVWGSAFITRSTHAYIGTDNELRVVNKGLSGIYRNLRAREFITDTSVREKKKNIEVYKESTFDIWRNANAYLYNRDTDEEGERRQLGLMIDELPEETHSDAGDSFRLYGLNGFYGRSFIEVVEELDRLKQRMSALESADNGS